MEGTLPSRRHCSIHTAAAAAAAAAANDWSDRPLWSAENASDWNFLELMSGIQS